MPVEEATYISDLNATYPLGTGEPKSLGDDHLRLLKSTIKATFPNITGAVTATHTELNVLDGITASTAELNILDGVTLTASQINAAALKSAANTFSAVQTISVADATTALDLRAESGKLISYPYSVGSAFIQSLNLEGSSYLPLTIEASTLTLTAASGITANGVNVTDFARKSQSNTFTAAQTIQATSAALTFDATADLRIGADAATTFVQAQTNHPLDFYTNNALRLRLGSDGNYDFKSGTVTTANSSASEVGYKGTPLREVTATGSTTAGDSGKTLYVTIAGGGTVTIDGSEHPVGTVITFISNDSSTGAPQSIAISDDTMYLAGTGFATTGTRTLAQGGMATAVKFTVNAWMINGTGLS